MSRCTQSFRDHLQYLNNQAACQAWQICMSGLEAVMGHVDYERVNHRGPRRPRVCAEHPLVTRCVLLLVLLWHCVCSYFLHLESDEDTTWETEEALAYSPDSARFLMAFNGWVMCDDPLRNFAEGDSQVRVGDSHESG